MPRQTNRRFRTCGQRATIFHRRTLQPRSVTKIAFGQVLGPLLRLYVRDFCFAPHRVVVRQTTLHRTSFEQWTPRGIVWHRKEVPGMQEGRRQKQMGSTHTHMDTTPCDDGSSYNRAYATPKRETLPDLQVYFGAATRRTRARGSCLPSGATIAFPS